MGIRLSTKSLWLGWLAWVIVVVAYALATVSLFNDPTWSCNETDDGLYGRTEVRLVPLGVDCIYAYDAAGQTTGEPTEAVREQRELAFPVGTWLVNVVLLAALLVLCIATFDALRHRDADRT